MPSLHVEPLPLVPHTDESNGHKYDNKSLENPSEYGLVFLNSTRMLLEIQVDDCDIGVDFEWL